MGLIYTNSNIKEKTKEQGFVQAIDKPVVETKSSSGITYLDGSTNDPTNLDNPSPSGSELKKQPSFLQKAMFFPVRILPDVAEIAGEIIGTGAGIGAGALTPIPLVDDIILGAGGWKAGGAIGRVVGEELQENIINLVSPKHERKSQTEIAKGALIEGGKSLVLSNTIDYAFKGAKAVNAFTGKKITKGLSKFAEPILKIEKIDKLLGEISIANDKLSLKARNIKNKITDKMKVLKDKEAVRIDNLTELALIKLEDLDSVANKQIADMVEPVESSARRAYESIKNEYKVLGKKMNKDGVVVNMIDEIYELESYLKNFKSSDKKIKKKIKSITMFASDAKKGDIPFSEALNLKRDIQDLYLSVQSRGSSSEKASVANMNKLLSGLSDKLNDATGGELVEINLRNSEVMDIIKNSKNLINLFPKSSAKKAEQLAKAGNLLGNIEKQVNKKGTSFFRLTPEDVFEGAKNGQSMVDLADDKILKLYEQAYALKKTNNKELQALGDKMIDGYRSIANTYYEKRNIKQVADQAIKSLKNQGINIQGINIPEENLLKQIQDEIASNTSNKIMLKESKTKIKESNNLIGEGGLLALYVVANGITALPLIPKEMKIPIRTAITMITLSKFSPSASRIVLRQIESLEKTALSKTLSKASGREVKIAIDSLRALYSSVNSESEENKRINKALQEKR